MKILTTWLLVLFVCGFGILNGQTKTNIEIFYDLVDSASIKAADHLPDKFEKIDLQLNLGSTYSLFTNQIRSKLQNAGYEIVTPANGSEIPVLSFTIDDARVSYSDPERDGLFGDYLTEREVSLSGNYMLSGNNDLKTFNFVFVDNLNVEDVDEVENPAYPFTQGNLPSEPFFSSIFEPVIAIGTAAVAVILFFTVRSK